MADTVPFSSAVFSEGQRVKEEVQLGWYGTVCVSKLFNALHSKSRIIRGDIQQDLF